MQNGFTYFIYSKYIWNTSRTLQIYPFASPKRRESAQLNSLLSNSSLRCFLSPCPYFHQHTPASPSSDPVRQPYSSPYRPSGNQDPSNTQTYHMLNRLEGSLSCTRFRHCGWLGQVPCSIESNRNRRILS